MKLQIELPLSSLERAQLTDRVYSFVWKCLQLTTIKEVGENGLADLTFDQFRELQKTFFLQGYKKLGLDKDPPAVGCAKYHYLSNRLGGVKCDIYIESNKKAWVRYPSPRWAMGDIADCVLDLGEIIAIFKGWQAHNGVSLRNPRLGFVLTHGWGPRGDDCMGGYFEEFDRELEPDERLQLRFGIQGPKEEDWKGGEFLKEEYWPLPKDEWPEERRIKAFHKYSLYYAESMISQMLKFFGTKKAAYMVSRAFHAVALQMHRELLEKFGIETRDAKAVATFVKLIGDLRGDVMVLMENPPNEYIVQQSSWRLRDSFDPNSEVPREIAYAENVFYETVCRLMNSNVDIRLTKLIPAGDRCFEWMITHKKK
jgi:hypothetical protein